MPHISKAHLEPNAFEKMRVNLAFQLFSEEVLKGLFVYRKDLFKIFQAVEPTEDLVRRMEQLVFVMSARIPSKALKPDSRSANFLEDFISMGEDF